MSQAAIELPPRALAGAHEDIPEAVYWRDYYQQSDTVYEWNNGRLEEKPVSDQQTYLIYRWFVKLLEFYLQTRPVADFTGLEMGFRLALPNKTTVRKPDLGVVLHANPEPLKLEDLSYHGIFDVCVEALSDSDKSQIERDTVIKKAEYAAIGVKEYFILHDDDLQAFYRLDARGVYVPILPQGGVVHSEVLPGFRFRLADLCARPEAEAMLRDPVYQDFVLPAWRQDKILRREAEQRAQVEARQRKAEARQRKQAEQHAQAEARQRKQAEQRAAEAEAELARLRALIR